MVAEVEVVDVVLVEELLLGVVVALAVLPEEDEAVGAADAVVVPLPDDFAPSSPLLQPATERLSVKSIADQNFFKIYPLSRSESAAPVRLVGILGSTTDKALWVTTSTPTRDQICGDY